MLRRAYSTRRTTVVATRFPTKYNAVRSAYKQKIQLPEGVVYNPTPAAPSALETPAAFVPKTDRRTVHKDAQDYNIAQMPQIAPSPRRTYNLGSEDFIEIQRLRETEPDTWTRKALARKFGVSEFVIGLASRPNPVRAAEMSLRLDVIKSMWNDRRARARAQRQQRKLLWLRDA